MGICLYSSEVCQVRILRLINQEPNAFIDYHSSYTIEDNGTIEHNGIGQMVKVHSPCSWIPGSILADLKPTIPFVSSPTSMLHTNTHRILLSNLHMSSQNALP